MNGMKSLFPVLLVAVLAGCTTPPDAADRALTVTIRNFSDERVAPRAQHLRLGVTAAAILAEQFAATGGVRVLLPPDGLEDLRTAWERRAENPSKPIEISPGRGRVGSRFWSGVAEWTHTLAAGVRTIYTGNGQTYALHIVLFVVVLYVLMG